MAEADTLTRLTSSWDSSIDEVSLYLRRCQVQTPPRLVSATWAHALEHRESFGTVVDFGAGDGRFADADAYDRYVGYEVDGRVAPDRLPRRGASILEACAFEADVPPADLVIGNPPFVRNQDLPDGWKVRAGRILAERTGVRMSGLANAWQYFFLLALASAQDDGLVALVVPYEWVSRPSARTLRDYISAHGWDVSVYRLVDSTFDSVLTTSSVTVVDKRGTRGTWRYFEEAADGTYAPLPSPTSSHHGVLPYLRRSDANPAARARRGLSPGSQKVLVLTEGERVRLGLRAGTDVVRCVTSLRNVPVALTELGDDAFAQHYLDAGAKCWLVNTDPEPSRPLSTYLASVPERDRSSATCLKRETWWKFDMPGTPDLLISMSFNGTGPKVVTNPLGLCAVGGVTGIYCDSPQTALSCQAALRSVDLRDRVVAYSHGLYKIEISQLNHLLDEAVRA